MKRKFLVSLTIAMFLLGMAGFANAALISIDFNDLSVGDVVTDQYASLGVSFSLLDTPAGYVDGPVAVSINSSTYPPADGIALVAGDDSRDAFYDIELSFSQAIDYFSMLSLDSDEPLYVRGYSGSTLMQEKYYPPGSNTQVWNLELGGIGSGLEFDRIVLDVVAGVEGQGYAGGPEFFDNLTYNPVPEPATLFLFGSGLLGFAARIRRKKK